MKRARLLRLDRPDPGAFEPPSSRLWRRYGEQALPLLDAIGQDLKAALPVLPPCEVLRCEVEAAARQEMVVTLEDFLRRRTEIALVTRRADLKRAPGLEPVSRILFGDSAAKRVEEYFRKDEEVGGAVPA